MDRIKVIKSIREALKNGDSSIGSWIQIPHASIAEIMGNSGYDWVAVDLEHGAIGVEQLPDLFRALELGGTLPLARLAQGSPKDCKQALDAGAGGVIVPMVNNAKQLNEIRNYCCWPPSGTRGVGFSRANLFGKNFDVYTKEAQAPLFVAMIESIQAVENLEDIVQVDGLDALLIGPYDLSASMGMSAQFDSPEFQATIDRIREIADIANIACGIHVVKPLQDELQQYIEQGYRFIPYSIDSVFLNYSSAKPSLG